MSDETLPVLSIIPPIAIGAAQLTSSNVVEVPPAAWSSGTNYALAATAAIYSGVSNTTADVWQSLQAGNLNHAPASSPTWWRKIGTTHPEFVPGGPLGAGYGGTARVIDSAAHLVYESLVNANMSADLADETSWALVGPTNKYAMFDNSNSTQSSAGQSIVVTVAPGALVDSIALFNVDAATVRIQSTSYDQTFSLADGRGIDDFYDWFFMPTDRIDELIVTDIPPYLGAAITITIANGTLAASVGNVVLGQRRSLGMPVANAGAGRVDYSKIDVNEWGDYTLTPRRSVKKLSCNIVVDNDKVDRVHALLDRYRATAIVWQASEQFAATQLFGIYRSFSTAFSWPEQSLCSLELEGLT